MAKIGSLVGKAAGRLLGKTYLVTGSTDGIGQHTALQLAKQGANVIVHGRNPERLAATAEELRANAQGGSISSYECDFASLQGIRKFAESVRKDHPRIDVLINNAGVFSERKAVSVDGFEMTWAINVLAPFLLTSLLLDSIKERIVNVASISAGSSIDFDNLNQEKGFSSHGAYSLSKLAMIMFTYELAERVKPRGLTANCLDPGTVNTKMLYQGWGSCGISLEDANDELFAAVDASLTGVSGQYFVGSRQSRSPQVSYNAQKCEQLWRILEKQTGASYP